MQNQLQLWLEHRSNINSPRQLLVLSGSHHWATQQAKDALSIQGQSNTLWVGTVCQPIPEVECIHARDYIKKLGHEFHTVIFDAYSGFRASAAIALSGTVKDGGLMVILCPSFENWPVYNDPESKNRSSHGYELNHSYFIQYLTQTFIKDPKVAIQTEYNFTNPVVPPPPPALPDRFRQQQLAIEAIKRVVTGHRNRPLVLTADRGRGKSSALGIAAASLMQERNKSVWLTAPSVNTVEQVFFHAQKNVKDGIRFKNTLKTSTATLSFKPVDILLNEPNTTDVLMVDEAAGIPLEILSQLAKKFPRIVFSSTLHGYEGSGRGFELRFKKSLAALKPEFKSIRLIQPIRWREEDPLETFWFNCLLYNHQTPDVAKNTSTVIYSKIKYESVAQKKLSQNPLLLGEVFSLLLSAHYQTSPDDVQRILDAPESQIITASCDNKVIGVLHIMTEGGSQLCDLKTDITSCNRRVKGHLVAQNIASTYNHAEFAVKNQWRISRIAISTDYQRGGIGSALIKHLVADAKSKGIDVITTAFGCTVELLRFWQSNQFSLIKFGTKTETSSGERSAICILPISSKSQVSLSLIRNLFIDNILYEIDKQWQAISPELMLELLLPLSVNITDKLPKLSPSQLQMLHQFSVGNRSSTQCNFQLRTFILRHIASLSELNLDQQKLLIIAILQLRPTDQLAEVLKLTGKKQIEKKLKEAVNQLLKVTNN